MAILRRLRRLQVTFDQLVLSDGTTVPIHSDSAVGIGRRIPQYLPASGESVLNGPKIQGRYGSSTRTE